MTRRVGQHLIIETEPDGTCELCGKEEETRCYGPNGEEVCFDCGMKYERSTKIQFYIRMHGMTREQAEAAVDKIEQVTP